MNNEWRIPTLIAPLAVAIVVGCGGARSSVQFTAGPNADFRSARNAEVRNGQDQVVLNGAFVASDSSDDDVERQAQLKGTGVDTDAAGEVEVESCREATCRSQEVEFSVVNLPPGATFRLLIDGHVFGTVTTDGDGRAHVERDVPLPR